MHATDTLVDLGNVRAARAAAPACKTPGPDRWASLHAVPGGSDTSPATDGDPARAHDLQAAILRERGINAGLARLAAGIEALT